jgi:hypothetical protein
MSPAATGTFQEQLSVMNIYADADRHDEPGYEEWAHEAYDPAVPEDEDRLRGEWAQEVGGRLSEELRVKLFEAGQGVRVLWRSHRYRDSGDGFACDVSVAFRDDSGRVVEKPLPALPPEARGAIQEACRSLGASDYDFDADFARDGSVEGVSVVLRPAPREKVLGRVGPMLFGDLSRTAAKATGTLYVSLARGPAGRAPRLRVRRRVRRCARAPGSSDDGPEPEPPPLARRRLRRLGVPALAGVKV